MDYVMFAIYQKVVCMTYTYSSEEEKLSERECGRNKSNVVDEVVHTNEISLLHVLQYGIHVDAANMCARVCKMAGPFWYYIMKLKLCEEVSWNYRGLEYLRRADWGVGLEVLTGEDVAYVGASSFVIIQCNTATKFTNTIRTCVSVLRDLLKIMKIPCVIAHSDCKLCTHWELTDKHTFRDMRAA